MTAEATGASSAGIRLARGLVVLALALAIIAIVLLAAGPLGWRAGLLHYRVGFFTLLPWAFHLGVAAVGIAALGLALGNRRLAGGDVVGAVAALAIAGIAIYFPWQAGEMRGDYPRINDITTDTKTPPPLTASIAARAAEPGASSADYGGPGVAAQQVKSYPDIVPAILPVPPDAAFARALATAAAMGWTIAIADPAAGRIEAYDRSRWFGFTDDIAIRITPDESGSRVDIRSASRQGRGDLGVNARRIRAFLAALKIAP
jgi:uncharacterized protein (DUF1499 family)